MTGLVSWWRLRSRREQWLLAVMLVLAAFTLAWLLVVRPLGDAVATANERHDRAVIALAEARAQALVIRRYEAIRAPAQPGPLEGAVSAAAAAAGFQLSRIQPDGENRIGLSLAAAKPQAFFTWLEALERGQGLVVERLNVTSNSDRTLAVELTLRKRGG
jgi:general secretion pathway protein M